MMETLRTRGGSRSSRLALLVPVVALLAVLVAVTAPPYVGAQDQALLRTIIEVNGGRSSEMVFQVRPPASEYLDEDDRIEILLPPEFILPSSVAADRIRLSGSGDPGSPPPVDSKSVDVSSGVVTVTIPNNLAERVGEGEHLEITIESGSGITAPETPIGFDDPADGYDVTINFVDTAPDPDVRFSADDKNTIVVRNPISSTVPGATVRVELHTYAEAAIGSSEEIIVDFSGPSEDSEFAVPSTIANTRITIRALITAGGSSTRTFSPSDVLVQGARVTLTLPDDRTIPVGDYTISFSQLARISNPFAAGNRIITVSSFAPGDELDEITAVIRRTTAISPIEGPRGSQFTLSGKGYAAGTVTVFDGADQEINPGETLASVKTSRGSFSARIEARGEPGDSNYKVWTRDSNGVIDSVEFDIRSSMAFEPSTVYIGGRLRITISDWEDEHQEVAAVRIGGVDAYTAMAIEYSNCFEPDPNEVYTHDDERKISFEVTVPTGVPPGEQTVAVYGHEQLELVDENNAPIENKDPCADLPATQNRGSLVSDSKAKTRVKLSPDALVERTVEIVARALAPSHLEAVRGQRVTVTGSGFTRNAREPGDIRKVAINGRDVVEDLSQFEVGTNGEVALTVTVPMGTRSGENEVQVIGWDGSLGQATLTVPEPSLTLSPAQSRIGSTVVATGSGFVANHFYQVTYGDGADVGSGEAYVGSGHTDARGNFRLPFDVPVTARIGKTYAVTAVAAFTIDGESEEVRAEASHTIPPGGIIVSPESVLPGDAITISVENLPAFARVGSVLIGGRDATPVPNASASGNGAVELIVTVPQLGPGEQTVRVEASGVILTYIIDVAEPPLSGPPSRVFRELILAGVLLRVWYLERSTQVWSFFDPAPEYAEFSNLEQVPSGEVVLIHLSAPHRFQGENLVAGWNPVGID